MELGQSFFRDVSLSLIFSCPHGLLNRINWVTAGETGVDQKTPAGTGIKRSMPESTGGCQHQPIFQGTFLDVVHAE
jgi:hypothetical protein